MKAKPATHSTSAVHPLGCRLDDQLAASAEDLRQAQALLNAAVGELLSCIQDPLGQSAAPGHADHDSAISARINQLLTKLQFEDMVTQLLRRAEFRLSGLRLVVAELARELEAGLESPDRAGRCRQLIDAHLRQLELDARDSIKQSDMRPGDVELF